MNLKQSFILALKSLQTSKMRSFLTMLGIIIGVAAVIAARDDLSFIDDHSADGDFADGDGFFRLLQGGFHIFDVFAGGGWYSLSGFIHNYWFHS